MLIESVVCGHELDKLEEVVENEINKVWKSGATFEKAVKAGARLRRKLEEEKNVNKSRG